MADLGTLPPSAEPFVEEAAQLPPGAEPFTEIEGLPPGAEPFDESPAAPLLKTMGVEKPTGPSPDRVRAVQQLTDIMGENYDPGEAFWGGWKGFLMGADIARSGTLADKQRKFQSSFPSGELIQVWTEDGPVLLARENADYPFRELAAPPRIAGAVVSEPVVAGMAGSAFGPVGTAIGTAAGVLAQTGIETERGFGAGEPGVGGAVTEGVLAGAVDVALRGAGRLILGSPNPPAIRMALADAAKASKELGLEPLAVGQVGGPFMRGMFRQVAPTTPIIERKLTAQELSLYNSVKETGKIPEGISQDALLDVVRAQQDELAGMIRLPAKEATRKGAGEALQEGIKAWKVSTKTVRDQLYDDAIALSDDIVFDLTRVNALAKEIDVGVLGKAKPGRKIAIEESLEMGIPVSAGTARGAVSLSETPQGQLKAVVDDIMELDTKISKFAAKGKEWTAFEQVKTLRTRLFDLKQSDDGAVRREASRLYNELTRTMDSPISGNPEFVEAYQKASQFNFIREDTLGKSFVAQALRTDTLDALGKKYMIPNHSTELALIRDLVPEEQFKQFRAAFMVDVMSAPTARQGLTRLENFKSFDKEGLRILASPTEQAQLESYLLRKAQFEASPSQKILDQQMTQAEQIVAAANKGTAGELADAVRLAGGIESDYAVAVRAGVYKDILDKSTRVTDQGVTVVDAKSLRDAILGWQKSGKLEQAFRPLDWRKIELYQKYAAPISAAEDIGGGMMAGGLRQQAIHAPSEITLYGDIKKPFKNVARSLFSNKMSAILLSRDASYLKLTYAGSGRRWLEAPTLALFELERELSRGEAK